MTRPTDGDDPGSPSDGTGPETPDGPFPVTDTAVGLPDDRRLGYSTYGDDGGAAVLFQHGVPGSRVLGRLLGPTAAELGVRVVAPDRPSYGLSDPAPEAGLTGRATDAVELLDALDVGRFGVVGFAEGSAFALAVAAAVPDRVEGVTLVSATPPPSIGEGPPDPGNGTTGAEGDDDAGSESDADAGSEGDDDAGVEDDPDDVEGVWETVFGTVTELLGSAVGGGYPGIEGQVYRASPREVLEQYADADRIDSLDVEVDVAATVQANLMAAFHDSTRGAARERALLADPWGVDFDRVDAPVALLYGDEDDPETVQRGRRLAGAVGGAFGWVPGEGDISTLLAVREAVLRHAAPGLDLKNPPPDRDPGGVYADER